VAAHEIGHLLLGANNHSRRGIMRPHWNRKDLEDAYFGRQGFTPQQTMRVEADVRARVEARVPVRPAAGAVALIACSGGPVGGLPSR